MPGRRATNSRSRVEARARTVFAGIAMEAEHVDARL